MSEIDPFMMPESPLDLDLESFLEPRQREMVVTDLYTQEAVDAMILAADEVDGSITVETFDASDDTEFRRYAYEVSAKERELMDMGMDMGWKPRTPEQVELQIQSYAVSKELVPAVVRCYDDLPDLGDFWAKQREILEAKES